MEPMNYCRQMLKQFSNAVKTPGFPEENRLFLSTSMELAVSAEKFMLPEGGRLYDDPQYRALNENERLNLPYPVIALEYSRKSCEVVSDDQVMCSKSILFAKELDRDWLELNIVVWSDHHRMWCPFPKAGMPRIGYLDRTQVINGRVCTKISCFDDRLLSDYADEVGALLCFLNVLQCNNVHVERIRPKRADNKNGKKIKTEFPFDTYHILTIDAASIKNGDSGVAVSGTHRSPREHLRRGHIRRLASGLRTWVNATVVAAGRGAGLVRKDYSLASRH